MLNEIGIIKLSKYHFYKNETNFFNNYKNEIINKFGSLDNLPAQILRNIEREKARLERYAEENSINAITEEIFSVKTSH
ncbi:MAG: hypothetical protein CVV49_08200 [Spirochaetae bacterium HGW-Spirochaetae-5]|nr:MAG: hypothetical protein CVV49_08200 [Spirochaetae bacterium HGW-Spirochaetae-5]